MRWEKRLPFSRWIEVALLIFLANTLTADLRYYDRLAEQLETSGVIVPTPHTVIFFEAESLSPEEMEEFSNLVERGILGIEDALGTEGVAPLRIYVTREIHISTTYTRHTTPLPDVRIFFEAERVRTHTAPYLHELVHAVAGEEGISWFEEGFASYVAFLVARSYGGYYIPLPSDNDESSNLEAHQFLARIDSKDRLSKLIAFLEDGEPGVSHATERAAFYSLGFSLVKFIGDEIGLRMLFAIYRGRTPEAFTDVTGRSLEEWQGEWLLDFDVSS